MTRTFSLIAALTMVATTATFAQDIAIDDAYARSASPAAKTGAAFMQIKNKGAEADRLVSVRSDAAARVELHTHIEGADGVMQMRHVEEGFVIPAGGTYSLRRGGDHVMFMGLTEGFSEGDTVELTLTFERAGDVLVTVPVDLTRKPDADAHGGSGHHSH